MALTCKRRGAGAATRCPNSPDHLGVEQPRLERVKNGAGVACIPELRAALRLKAFEARPDAVFGPSDGSEVEKNERIGNGTKRRLNTDGCGPREFGAGAVAAKQRKHSMCRSLRKAERECK